MSLEGPLPRHEVQCHVPSFCQWLEWAGLRVLRASSEPRGVLRPARQRAVLARIGPRRNTLLHGLSAMAELEALCSLACFCAELPVACWPRRTRTGPSPSKRSSPPHPGAECHSQQHPLESQCEHLGGHGSECGGQEHLPADGGSQCPPGPGRRRRCGQADDVVPVRLITDVRIRDDLAHNESYFLSEVRRLRRLVLDAEPAHRCSA